MSVTMGCYDVEKCCYGLWGSCSGVLGVWMSVAMGC